MDLEMDNHLKDRPIYRCIPPYKYEYVGMELQGHLDFCEAIHLHLSEQEFQQNALDFAACTSLNSNCPAKYPEESAPDHLLKSVNGCNPKQFAPELKVHPSQIFLAFQSVVLLHPELVP